MSIADKIAFVAAIAAVIAAVAAIASWVVACRSEKQSKRSANAAEKSATEAQRANDLMAQQLEMATGELKRQIQKDIKDGQPCITWNESSAGVQSVTYKLKNHGGTISNVALICDVGFQSSISPKDIIAQGTEAEVRFICDVQPQPNPFKFSIEADDKFNQRRKINFTISRQASGYWQLPELSQN